MSLEINVYNQKGEVTGKQKLSAEIFGVELNEALVHQAMVTQMANKRQALAHTKDRSEVRGGGRKPWRQKGTGRARAGSNRSPIWIGGGVTFGPTKERNFSKKINRKMKQKAVNMVLSDKAENDSIVLFDKIEQKEFKTKVIAEMLGNVEKDAPKNSEAKASKRSFLIINSTQDEKLKFSARNLTGVKVINLNNINIVDLLKYQNLILTQDALTQIEGKNQAEKAEK